MEAIMQWGGTEVSVQWSNVSSSFEYTCIFGCWENDFESEAEALDKFLNHACISEPCS